MIGFEKIEYRHPKEICHNTNVILIVKRIPQMDAFVPIPLIVKAESRQNPQLYPGGVPIFRNGADDLDSTVGLIYFVICLNYFAKGTLAKQFLDSI